MNYYERYKTWLFDCDGVLLDSNNIKSQAFYQVALPFGETVAKEFLDYHQGNGGLSRFKKFEFLYKNILKVDYTEETEKKSLDQFEKLVKSSLMTCSCTPGLVELMDLIPKSCKKYVISGGLQSELKEIFFERDLQYFNGIYGGPRTKYEIIDDLLATDQSLLKDAVFIGDSELDYKVAHHYNIDFIFMSRFTEFKGWKEYFENKNIRIIETLEALQGSGVKDARDLNSYI